MIVGVIICALVGVICIVLGISNCKGNISSLHEYHRNRVADEDILPFGKAVGSGIIITGASALIFAAASLWGELANNATIITIGTALLLIGLAVGIGVCIYATKKYNKGVF